LPDALNAWTGEIDAKNGIVVAPWLRGLDSSKIQSVAIVPDPGYEVGSRRLSEYASKSLDSSAFHFVLWAVSIGGRIRGFRFSVPASRSTAPKKSRSEDARRASDGF